MTINELENMKKKLIAEDRSQAGYNNLSGINSKLIKEAAKCKMYASDVIYEIEYLKIALKELKPGKDYISYLGYRELGVDGTDFILCRKDSEYRKLQKIVASLDIYGYVTIKLYTIYPCLVAESNIK
jgi:hypothetical protein